MEGSIQISRVQSSDCDMVRITIQDENAPKCYVSIQITLEQFARIITGDRVVYGDIIRKNLDANPHA
jgi:hypothetical protein